MRKLLVIASLLIAASALAADTKTAITGSGVYGTAGCGLGSMAFGAQEGMVQIFAATTNGLFRSTDGGQTFSDTRALTGDPIFDVDFHPLDSQVCMAAGRHLVQAGVAIPPKPPPPEQQG